eukprot:TRINITY_DN1093_c0_g1_i14.p1 TRINITY_DN1093_c0_g1~~TRINITY_DN1093_c0_g1_i14.p1  ORF type:complete len:885 (+),score=102.37 TRINITY_DN1093_c0_g1_i14:100-2754(+)
MVFGFFFFLLAALFAVTEVSASPPTPAAAPVSAEVASDGGAAVLARAMTAPNQRRHAREANEKTPAGHAADRISGLMAALSVHDTELTREGMGLAREHRLQYDPNIVYDPPPNTATDTSSVIPNAARFLVGDLDATYPSVAREEPAVIAMSELPTSGGADEDHSGDYFGRRGYLPAASQVLAPHPKFFVVEDALRRISSLYVRLSLFSVLENNPGFAITFEPLYDILLRGASTENSWALASKLYGSSSYMPVSYKECGNATDALFSRLMLDAVPTRNGAFFSGAHCTLLGDPPRSGGRRSASRVDISHTRTVAGLCRSHIRSSLDLKEDELAMTGLNRIFRNYIRTSPLCDADPSDDEINEMVQQLSAKADTSDNKSYKTTAKSLTPSLQAFLRSDFATASAVPSNAHAVAAEALARFDEACVQSSALFGLARKQERKAARAATMRDLSAAVAAAEATARGAAVHTPERRLADKAVAVAKRLRDDTKAFFSRFTKLEALDFKSVTTANRLQLASRICFPGLPSGLRVLIMTDPDRAGVVCHLAAVRALARDKAISDQGDAPPEQVELDRLCNQFLNKTSHAPEWKFGVAVTVAAGLLKSEQQSLFKTSAKAAFDQRLATGSVTFDSPFFSGVFSRSTTTSTTSTSTPTSSSSTTSSSTTSSTSSSSSSSSSSASSSSSSSSSDLPGNTQPDDVQPELHVGVDGRVLVVSVKGKSKKGVAKSPLFSIAVASQDQVAIDALELRDDDVNFKLNFDDKIISLPMSEEQWRQAVAGSRAAAADLTDWIALYPDIQDFIGHLNSTIATRKVEEKKDAKKSCPVGPLHNSGRHRLSTRQLHCGRARHVQASRRFWRSPRQPCYLPSRGCEWCLCGAFRQLTAWRHCTRAN